MTIIDAHQHLWQPLRGDYDWMPKGDPVLDRAYLPADLGPILAANGVAGTVLVQAAATVDETEYMLGLADGTRWVLGVVGWVDFEAPGAPRVLERLARHPKFRGVRPMIQDIPDDDWMLRADIQPVFEALAGLDLTFDALGFPRHIANFRTLLARHRGLRTVLDHCLKPQIRDPAGYPAWADGMAALAAETDACIKLSALVTEADNDWSDDALRPYADHILRVFGPERMMWGSDWPVCRLRCEYGDWLAQARRLTEGAGPTGQARIFAGTAAAFYRVEVG